MGGQLSSVGVTFSETLRAMQAAQQEVLQRRKRHAFMVAPRPGARSVVPISERNLLGAFPELSLLAGTSAVPLADLVLAFASAELERLKSRDGAPGFAKFADARLAALDAGRRSQISPDLPRSPQISPDLPRSPQISPDLEARDGTYPRER